MAARGVPKCLACNTVPATFQCSCQFPSFLSCANCLAGHVATPGNHFTTQGVNADVPRKDNTVCEDCKVVEATHFCICAVPFRKHCDSCESIHSQERGGVHFKHPIVALEYAQRVQVTDFLNQQLFIQKLYSNYEENVRKLDLVIEQVGDDFDRLIEIARNTKEECIRQLRQMREELVVQVAETTATIQAKRYVQDFQPASELENIILSGWRQGSVPSIQLFSASLSLEAALIALSNCFQAQMSAQISSQFEITCIPIVKQNNRLMLFSLEESKLSEIPLQQMIQIDSSTAYCYISPDSLLCCGGKHNLVYEVNVVSGLIFAKQSMLSFRGSAGIFNQGGYVYMIAGLSHCDALSTAEKYELATNTWKQTKGNLAQALYGCTPCLHNEKAYIVGCNVISIEIFDLITELFSPFPLSLNETWWSPSFIANGNLLILQKNKLLQWTIGSSEIAFRSSAILNNTSIYCNCPPVQINRNIYFLRTGNVPRCIEKFNFALKTLEVVKETDYFK